MSYLNENPAPISRGTSTNVVSLGSQFTNPNRNRVGNNNLLWGSSSTFLANATSSVVNSVILGSGSGDALTTGQNNILIGNNAGSNLTTGSYNVILGNPSALAAVNNSVLIGQSASVSAGTFVTVVGPNSVANGQFAVSLGYFARSAEQALAIGSSSNAQGPYDIAMLGMTDTSGNAVSIGRGASTAGGIAIGFNASTSAPGDFSVSPSSSASTGGTKFRLQGFAIGGANAALDQLQIEGLWLDNAHATRRSALNLNVLNVSTPQTAIRINANTSGTAFTGINTTTPGTVLQVNGGVAVTSSSAAASDPGAGNLTVAGNLAVGSAANGAVVIQVPSTYGIQITTQSSTVSGTGVVGIGRNVTASASQAIAIGESSSCTATRAIALGNGATASAQGSIAIGNATTSFANTLVFSGNVGNDKIASNQSNEFVTGGRSVSGVSAPYRIRAVGNPAGADAEFSSLFNISGAWADTTFASRRSRLDLDAYYLANAQTGVSVLANTSGTPFTGINTTTPGSALQVNGGLTVTAGSTAATDPGAGNISAQTLIAAGADGSKGIIIRNGSTNVAEFNSDGVGHVRVRNLGLTGSFYIGMASPGSGSIFFQTNGENRGSINSNGTLSMGGRIEAANFKLSALNTAPASASDTGTTGEIRIDANFIYVCTATNTWKRAAISTW